MKEITKSNRGITLIALVVTIVVLLILAGVSIATLTGQNGILTQADKAKTETVKVGVQEKVQLEVQGSYDETRTINLDLLNNNLKNNIKGLTYKGTEISDTNKITSLPEIVEVDGYKYHKKDNKQKERDILKNNVLSKYNIPLIRLTTNASREENIIRSKLDRIVNNK